MTGGLVRFTKSAKAEIAKCNAIYKTRYAGFAQENASRAVLETSKPSYREIVQLTL